MIKTYTKLSTPLYTYYVDKTERLYAQRYWKDYEKAENIISQLIGISPEEFGYKNSEPKIVKARHMLWYLLKNRFEWSFSRTARHYKYNHSTVRLAIKSMDNDSKIRETLDTAVCTFPHVRPYNNSNNKLF